jgi:hypothetical protein
MVDAIDDKEKLAGEVEALLQEKRMLQIRFEGVDYRLVKLPQNTNVLYVGGAADFFNGSEVSDEQVRMLQSPDMLVELDGRFDILQSTAAEGEEIAQQTVDEILGRMVEDAARQQLGPAPETNRKRITDIDAILIERGAVEAQYEGEKYRLHRGHVGGKYAFVLSKGGHFALDKRINPETGKPERFFTPPDYYVELDGNLSILNIRQVKPGTPAPEISDEKIRAIVDRMIRMTAVW